METLEYKTCRGGDVTEFPTPHGALLYHHRLGRLHYVSPARPVSFGRLSEFRSNEEHALALATDAVLANVAAAHVPMYLQWVCRWLQRFASRHPAHVCLPRELDAFRRVVDTYHAAGLIDTHEETVRRCRVSAVRASSARIQLVAIPTRNRPAALARALASVAANNAKWGRSPAYIVVDSSDPLRAETNRAALRAISRQYSLRVRYDGPSARRDYAVRLARQSGVPEEVVSFGLLGLREAHVTIGASRNHILLHSIGRLCLHLDDDTVCNVRRPACHASGIIIGGGENWLHYDHLEKPSSKPPIVDDDYLSIHEAALGRPAAALVTDHLDGGVDATCASHRVIDDIESGEATVVGTMTGIAGDSGEYNRQAWMLLNNPSPARVRRWTHPQSARSLVRCAPRFVITDRPWCMAVNLGLDNRRPLPPFVPVYRNEDGVFALVVRVGRRADYLALVPWLIDHDPEPAVASARSAGDLTWDFRLCDLLSTLIETSAHGSAVGPGHHSLESLGRDLRDAGALADRSFEELARTLMSQVVAGRVEKIEMLIDAQPGRPRSWAAALRRCQSTLRDRCAARDAWLPVDVEADVGRPGAMGVVKRIVGLYGQLLEGWPTLCTHARREARPDRDDR